MSDKGKSRFNRFIPLQSDFGAQKKCITYLCVKTIPNLEQETARIGYERRGTSDEY